MKQAEPERLKTNTKVVLIVYPELSVKHFATGNE